VKNLLADIPKLLTEELIENIACGDSVRIERIVSSGHSSPKGFWYDQDENEWVVVLSGEAKLQFDNDRGFLHLRTGDHVDIAAHERHRVEWTLPNQPTIWLAVFYRKATLSSTG
jgi:cupin 2 domain-containing protein